MKARGETRKSPEYFHLEQFYPQNLHSYWTPGRFVVVTGTQHVDIQYLLKAIEHFTVDPPVLVMTKWGNWGLYITENSHKNLSISHLKKKIPNIFFTSSKKSL